MVEAMRAALPAMLPAVPMLALPMTDPSGPERPMFTQSFDLQDSPMLQVLLG
jgi:hypothetical protein